MTKIFYIFIKELIYFNRRSLLFFLFELNRNVCLLIVNISNSTLLLNIYFNCIDILNDISISQHAVHLYRRTTAVRLFCNIISDLKIALLNSRLKKFYIRGIVRSCRNGLV